MTRRMFFRAHLTTQVRKANPAPRGQTGTRPAPHDRVTRVASLCRERIIAMNRLLALTATWAGTFWMLQVSVQGQDTDLARFRSVDTSSLMGQPDAHAVFGVETAFPQLRFERPVDL